jgi:hypothetical protein
MSTNPHPHHCICRFNEDGETTCGIHEHQTITYYDDIARQE